MPDLYEMPASAVNQAVYVTIAFVKEDPQLDILAGITYYMLQQHPALGTEAIQAAVGKLQAALASSSPDRQFDLSPHDAIYMSRVLPRLVPVLADAHLQDGARAYTRAFLKSYRRGVDAFRQVAPIESQIDQFGEVDRFRRDTWEKLYELAAQQPPVAAAVNQSAIGTGLGIQTTQEAAALLATVPIQPLTDILAVHRQPDGTLRVPLAEVETALAQASNRSLELGNAYAQNFFELNRVEQATRDAGGIQRRPAATRRKTPGKAKEKTELEKAIEKAEAKQKDLDKLLGDVRSGVKGTLDVFAVLAAKSNDKEFADDIKKFTEVSVAILDDLRKYSKGVITTAKKVADLLNYGATGFTILSGVGCTVALVAIGIKIFGILGKKQGPSVNEQILQQLGKISTQIRDLRTEMNQRFDRIEKQLNQIFDQMLEQFARINFELGQIEGNVTEIQFALFQLHGTLQRMNRNIHAFLESAGRRDLVEAINGFLNFRELTGQDLDFDAFLQGENQFFSWGFSHAQDPLQAGPLNRDFADSNLLEELTNFPLATNINYLRQLPDARLGLAPLAGTRLANPTDWLTAAEGYAQLSEEWPDHAASISAARVQQLANVGELLGDSLAKIADMNLFNRLADHYREQFQVLRQQVAAFEKAYRDDPATGLHGIDLWGGANQVPKTHPLAGTKELGRCDGGRLPTTLTTDLSRFDHSELTPYLIAHNLGLAALLPCVVSSWKRISLKPLFGERFIAEYQLVLGVDIRYNGQPVYQHRFNSDRKFTQVLLRKDLDTFNPDTNRPPYSPVPELWPRLQSFPATHQLVNPGLRTATLAAVEAALKLQQRDFYGQVAQRLEQLGDALQVAGDRLTGSKLLWEAFVTMGLPLSVEANEFLRGLLFGSDAILAGTDAGSPDGLLDDVRDIYAYFSAREEAPPNAHIIADIEALVNDRVTRLTTTLTDIVGHINTTGEPEPPELFAPTLLRLSLIKSREA